MGQTQSLPPASLAGSPLQVCLNDVFASSTGSVAYPQNYFYQFLDVKPYNHNIPITPAAVTFPATTDDVSKIVQCAAASNVKVQPRSGGHSYGNYGIGGVDNAVVVDLSNFQQFSMDNTTWQATIGAGSLLKDVTNRLSKAGGRAIAHGTCPQVGIGGHATIGGLGPLSRQWGAALDHVLEVEIVLANGTVTRASDTQNPDLLFAVKGAGASFGIITEFVVLTHPVPKNIRYSYTLLLGSHAAMAPTFATWQSIVSDPALDRKLATEVVLFELGMIISGTYFGTEEEYKSLNFEQRLSQNATVSVTVFDDWLGAVGNWAETEALQLVGGASGPFYAKSLTFSADTLIPARGIESFFSYLDSADKGTLIWFAIFDLQGGAVNDIPQNATAFAHRDVLFYLQTYAVGVGTLSDKTIAFVNGMSEKITDSMPGVNFGAYPGYVDPQLTDAQTAYWGSNLPRLEQIKAAIDPQNLFSNPQSVQPATSQPPTFPPSFLDQALSVGTLSQELIALASGMSEEIMNSMPDADFGAQPGHVDSLLTHAQTAYWGSNLPRLEQIKAVIDPQSSFSNPTAFQPPTFPPTVLDQAIR
ncbi:hypothetical protein MSAN_01903900 [Mycena sanguinolenta]|uniref:FAD-binding PCMH-type domain-containing protein n=1 Tax=Mycena sanguinolenta TaxID=230812 RepID=A0A8H6XQH2_9AGAR|nr:hypothetical protein MSAN_01903900 [Mycena sanguinolenta]